jgi:hypothetical protein
MREPPPAPGNGSRSNVKGDYLKASVCQFLGIIPKPTSNHESELSCALNVSAIQPPDEVGIGFHISPVEGLLISLSLRIQFLKPARCIPTLYKFMGELSRLCSCLLFHVASPVFSLCFRSCTPVTTLLVRRERPDPCPILPRRRRRARCPGSRPGAGQRAPARPRCPSRSR